MHPGPDVLELAPGTHGVTIAGAGENQAATGDLDITTPVRVSHTGINQALVTSRVTDERVFHVFGTGVVLQGLTITGGFSGIEGSDHGGGILNEGVLTVKNSTITDNGATYGGGISTNGTSELTVVNSTVSGNTATAAGACLLYTSPSPRDS